MAIFEGFQTTENQEGYDLKSLNEREAQTQERLESQEEETRRGKSTQMVRKEVEPEETRA